MNKFIKSILILSIGMGLLSSCVVAKPAQTDTVPRTITVSGNGSVSLKPDLVYLKFLVRTMDWNVSKAVEKNAANSDFVLKALEQLGIASTDISTFDYSISQDNSNNYPGQYTVRNTIAVVVRNIEITGSVIDAVIKNNAGANGLTSFKYAVSDKESALRQARTLAIQNAQDAANLLAGASGCKITGVQTISEFSPSYYDTGEVLLKASDRVNGTQIKEGTIGVSSQVTITYLMEN